MSNRVRLQIIGLRLSAAHAYAAQLVVRTALLVRSSVTAWTLVALYLPALRGCTRIAPAQLAAYLRAALLAPAESGTDRSGPHRRAHQPDQAAGAQHTPLQLAAGTVAVLRDPRVRRLQRRVVGSVFASQFSLTPAEGELAVLEAFSSVAWLAAGLQRAAGAGGGYDAAAPFSRRCALVFPVFMQAMRLHLRYLSVTQSRGRGRLRDRLRRHWLMRRYAVGPDGSIRGALYPERVSEQSRRMRVAAIRRETRATVRTARGTAQLRYFHTYLQALTLVMRTTADRPWAARRALERIERIHARLTEPGR